MSSSSKNLTQVWPGTSKSLSLQVESFSTPTISQYHFNFPSSAQLCSNLLPECCEFLNPSVCLPGFQASGLSYSLSSQIDLIRVVGFRFMCLFLLWEQEYWLSSSHRLQWKAEVPRGFELFLQGCEVQCSHSRNTAQGLPLSQARHSSQSACEFSMISQEKFIPVSFLVFPVPVLVSWKCLETMLGTLASLALPLPAQ